MQNLPAPEGGQVEIWDAKIPGFGVRVGHTGVKTFVMVYRIRGRWRRDTLGQYPKVKLADARGKAEVARADLREGRDPRDKRKTSRPAPKSECFGTIVDDFITRHAKRHNRPSSAAEIELHNVLFATQVCRCSYNEGFLEFQLTQTISYGLVISMKSCSVSKPVVQD